MSKTCRKILVFLYLTLTAFPPLFAFANNNVRVDKFKWMVVKTEHFDIYYDEKTAPMVPRMAAYLEGAWKEAGAAFDYLVPTRTPFFFYSDHNRFEQTNIVPIGEGTGGVTEAFKNRLVIFNDGSETWLRHVVYHEFGHVIQFNILYGGFWKSIRLLKSPFYPLWMMEGMAEYGSGEIDDPVTDMVIRDAVNNKQVPLLAELQGFAHLKPNQITLGYKTGEVAIRFLNDEFGSHRAADLLVKMKDHFDVSSALDELLGLDLNRFDFRFHEWLDEKYAAFLSTAQPPTVYGPKLTTSDKIPQFNEAPALSPDGKKIYFFSDRTGTTQLFAYDIETKKEEPLVPLNYLVYENVQTRGRALSISPDGRYLAFSGEKKQRDYLFLFDLEKRKLKRIKVPFDEIRTPSFSPIDSNQILCVGMENGYNDIYVLDRKGHVVKRLTNSPQDERDPVFTADAKNVVFSGEVMSEDGFLPIGRDLFSLDAETRALTPLTSLLGEEIEPEPLPDGSILFVRDRDDAGQCGYDICRLDPKTGASTTLTHFSGGGFSPRYSTADNSIYYIAFFKGEKHIYKGSWTFPAAPVAAVPEKKSEPDDVLGDVPMKKHGKRSLASLSWPADSNSPLFASPAKRYRFSASTDLFLPFFYYSTAEGLVFMNVWQFSEMMGNHQFQEQTQYASGNDFVNLSLVYTYARFQPQFTVGMQTSKFYTDFDQKEQRQETQGVGIMGLPLDRVSTWSIGAGATERKDVFLDGSDENTKFHDRFALTSLSYDTVNGRYLIPTRGRRLEVFYQQGFGTVGGDQRYRTGGAEAIQYTPIPGESTIASRLFYGRSTGPQSQVFRIGGVDKIRALSGDSLANKTTNAVYGNVEARLKIKYLNARTKFLFPDFFFKAAYLILFEDMGYGWDNTAEREAFKPRELENTTGVGISWPTFILQSYQLNLTVQWAHQTNTGRDIWYITVGPSF